MFRVTTTGKNPNYGKKGQKRHLADTFLMVAVKRGWIEPQVKYVGQGGGQLRIIDTHDKCRLCGQVKKWKKQKNWN
jgi:hypothetical protein